ncbi:Dps family protein [Cucumibacter marinus]|uniref:Dps family protein n=1 Tax=Cucumibacter marinus TaxID=1121252 RepID=UPI000420D517|nr:DNA starvation/stationary phase protection protein [Cucumibacter marinus]
MSTSVLRTEATVTEPETGINSTAKLAHALEGCLADTYVLMIKTQAFHWNVVGPLFFSIHNLTEEHYQDLFEAADDLAERVRALGHPAPGSISKMLDESVVTEEKDDTLEAAEMLKTLVNDHEAVARRFRETAELAEEQKDIVTADMLTARITFHEKAIWMLRAITAK